MLNQLELKILKYTILDIVEIIKVINHQLLIDHMNN